MIIRRQITSNFTVIPNEAILDTRLSAAARWLLVYLLSRPNDWQVQVGDIQKKGGVGREKAYRLIKELISVGWVRKSISREDSGQWGGIEYVITDQPEVEEAAVSPCDEKPYLANSLTANHHLTKDLRKPRTERLQNTENNILVDEQLLADFEEFWAAYPKRSPHSNPKHPASINYVNARQKLNVSREVILEAAKVYAATMAGKDPQHVAQAKTWLNQRRWGDEYDPAPADIPQTKAAAPAARDEQLDTLAAVYPGHIGERDRAKKLLAAELSKGVSLNELCVAAEKYRLFCKGPPYEDRRITPSMLEPWLQFKWREMDAYEFCKVGADRIRTVRPIKVKT